MNSATSQLAAFAAGLRFDDIPVSVVRKAEDLLVEFEQHFRDAPIRALCNRVELVFDGEVDAAYPRRWIGKVTVHSTDGGVLHGRVDEPKGDPGNTLSREETTAKAMRLAAFSGAATAARMQASVTALWQVTDWPRVGTLLEQKS